MPYVRRRKRIGPGSTSFLYGVLIRMALILFMVIVLGAISLWIVEIDPVFYSGE